MNRPEVLRALRMGHDEIIRLRREIDELRPKAHAYSVIAQLAALSKHEQPQGYGEDVAWRMKQMVETIEAERAAERTAQEGEEV